MVPQNQRWKKTPLDLFERHQGGERTLLVHVTLYPQPDHDPEEFRLLAASAGAQILGEYVLNRSRADPRLLIGEGKTQEIAAAVKLNDIDLVMFSHPLTPAQERNLEKEFECRVVDRTGLILDIFAQRARTFEGKLQVELAQLEHLSSRLVRGWTHLERQKGGIGLRGPGETQLETDRRLLRHRVTALKARLAKVRQTRQQGRAARQKAAVPTISLVGYTNAGKSTLFNRLAGSDVYAADQLFATLDPTLRRLDWPGLGPVVLADTVGFVRDLPHELVDAFRATLEETLEADLLLHVIDAASPERFEQMQAVEQVLHEVGAVAPVLQVHNKIDASGDAPAVFEASAGVPDRVFVSARSSQGIDLLEKAVAQRLSGTTQHFELTLDFSQGRLLHQLHALGVVASVARHCEGHQVVQVQLPASRLAQLLGQAGLVAAAVLSAEQAALLVPPPEAFERLDGGASPQGPLPPATDGVADFFDQGGGILPDFDDPDPKPQHG